MDMGAQDKRDRLWLLASVGVVVLLFTSLPPVVGF